DGEVGVSLVGEPGPVDWRAGPGGRESTAPVGPGRGTMAGGDGRLEASALLLEDGGVVSQAVQVGEEVLRGGVLVEAAHEVRHRALEVLAAGDRRVQDQAPAGPGARPGSHRLGLTV